MYGKHYDEEMHGMVHDHAETVSNCEAAVQMGFLRKVFGLVAAQLLLTGLMCTTFMFVPPVHSFVLHTPSMLFLTFISSLGFLFACQCYKDQHPTNLYLLAGFTVPAPPARLSLRSAPGIARASLRHAATARSLFRATPPLPRLVPLVPARFLAS